MEFQPQAEKIVANPEQQCEACGVAFGCGAASGNCWCFAVELTSETLARIQARYGNCLCPQCLQSFAETPLPPGEAGPS